LVKLEMHWTVNWFRHKQRCWKERLDCVVDEERDDGLKCYCHKQIALWKEFADGAEQRFSGIVGPLSSWYHFILHIRSGLKQYLSILTLSDVQNVFQMCSSNTHWNKILPLGTHKSYMIVLWFWNSPTDYIGQITRTSKVPEFKYQIWY